MKVNISKVDAFDRDLHELEIGDLVTVVSAHSNLEDKYILSSIKTPTEKREIKMPKMPSKIDIPGVTIDFNKLKDSAVKTVKKAVDGAKSISVEKGKEVVNSAVSNMQNGLQKANDKFNKAIESYVPTIVMTNIYTGKVFNLTKLYLDNGGDHLTDLYITSLQKHVSFVNVLINGYYERNHKIYDGINTLTNSFEIRYIGRFLKDEDTDKEAVLPDSEKNGKGACVGKFDDLFNSLKKSLGNIAVPAEDKDDEAEGDVPSAEEMMEHDFDVDTEDDDLGNTIPVAEDVDDKPVESAEKSDKSSIDDKIDKATGAINKSLKSANVTMNDMIEQLRSPEFKKLLTDALKKMNAKKDDSNEEQYFKHCNNYRINRFNGFSS